MYNIFFLYNSDVVPQVYNYENFEFAESVPSLQVSQIRKLVLSFLVWVSGTVSNIVNTSCLRVILIVFLLLIDF